MTVEEVQRNAGRWVTVYVSYYTDDSELDPDIEAYRIVWNIPPGRPPAQRKGLGCVVHS